MKLKILSTSLLLALGISKSAYADIIALVSPFQSKETAKQQLVTTVNIMQKMALGEKMVILNAENAETIATLKVPEDKRLSHPSSRMNANASQIALLKRFISKTDVKNRTPAALNLPFTLKKVAQYHRYANDILVMGTARMDIPEISQDVVSGEKILLDDNITQSSDKSIFGTANEQELLKGLRIHWWVTSEYEQYPIRKATERFYHLWLHNLSAELVSYSTDINAVLRLLQEKAPALPMPYQLNADTQNTTNHSVSQHLFNMQLATEALDKQRWHNPQKLRIGIRWQGDVDLDIYAAQSITKKPVYYANPRNAGAKHLKDITRGSDNQAILFEMIEFHQAVDLCDVVVGINHYSGSVSGETIRGAIRAEVNHKVYEVPFVLGANVGNQGKDIRDVMRSGANSDYSLKLAITDIAGNQVAKECVA